MIDSFTIEPLKFVVPIVSSMRRQAEQFRQFHPQPAIAERAFLNSLAVFAAQYYLDCMGFETDLTGSDSCNPVMQALLDTADLPITALGKLECRPVQVSDRHCRIPPDVQRDRLGYLVVQIDVPHREATLLGFCQTAPDGILSLEDLQPLDALLAALHQPVTQPAAATLTVHLSQWVQGRFAAGWQHLEERLTPKTLSLAFRSGTMTAIKRAHPLRLATPGTECHVDGIFVVVLQPETSPEAFQNMRLQLQVHAVEEFLSPGLLLKVIDETGSTFVQTIAGATDRLIQTPLFQGRSGERFRAVVALNQDSVAIDFVI
ncbi:MAG: DUF1822 family protein [Cyanobacteria bacterium CRU_2_1]|nr:DUF1822 family protein [Cyanobacteria bacterium CRU_2_1]